MADAGLDSIIDEEDKFYDREERFDQGVNKINDNALCIIIDGANIIRSMAASEDVENKALKIIRCAKEIHKMIQEIKKA